MARPSTPSSREPADKLHSGMVRLLRRLARRDSLTGLSPARLSALSVLVFRGPLTLAELAGLERVRPPTMSRIVAGLEQEGLAGRTPHPSDGRSIQIRPTAAGRAALRRGQRARVAALRALLHQLAASEQKTLEKAADLLLELAERPESGC